jgi:type 1 glutamine amidotransferase/nicotinamidase-related amidase
MNLYPRKLLIYVSIFLSAEYFAAHNAGAQSALNIISRSLEPSPKDPLAYLVQLRPMNWELNETAIIVCDMWDMHHCLNATNRVAELAPRMNDVLKAARTRGVFIIHAPSECMKAYENHPGRQIAQHAPKAANSPPGLDKGCEIIPREKSGKYPIDQSDGGCDSEPVAQAAFSKKLKEMGRNPDAPWLREHEALSIEPGDAISDSGVEIWNLMEQRGIKNVILMGVHTNMCVLGRPFGLRQMAKNGKNVVLMRDMTDTMYNPQRWPNVSHFTGTDLIVEHIEKFVCHTITSDQLIGGKPFRFSGDKRKHLVMIIADEEYATDRTLPEFARQYLGRDFKVSFVTWPKHDSDDLPGIEVLEDADLALFSVWRRTPPKPQMDVIRKFVADGKPVVGIRTSSHAFVKRDGSVAPDHAAWPKFDSEVLGGNYRGHFAGEVPGSRGTIIKTENQSKSDPILREIPDGELLAPSWLYKMSPLEPRTKLLLTGRVDGGSNEEPVAWTYRTSGGGRAFYTSLGHPKEFQLPWFQELLANAINWAARMSVNSSDSSKATGQFSRQ